MNTCTAAFERLAQPLAGLRCDGNPVVEFHNPFGLQNWTLPVIEFVMVAGMIGCLIHGIRRYRRGGDSTNLVVWCTGIVALLIIEPVAYFPQWFGMDNFMGLTFVHNQFSVQFLFDRLPLYIVAMYPVYGYISYTLVQRAGVFRKYHVTVGAVCVAFVFHALFEIVDTVAPQFRWWAWNTDAASAPTAVPALGVVPLMNMQSFTIGLPFGMVLAARLICKPGRRSRRILLRDVVVVSLLVWPIQLVFNAPAAVLSVLGVDLATARSVVIWTYIATFAAVGAAALAGAHRARRTDPDVMPAEMRCDYFPLVYSVVYLIASVAFWIVGARDNLRAVDGVTPEGAPIGSLPYAVVAFVASVLILIACYTPTVGRVVDADTGPESVPGVPAARGRIPVTER